MCKIRRDSWDGRSACAFGTQSTPVVPYYNGSQPSRFLCRAYSVLPNKIERSLLGQIPVSNRFTRTVMAEINSGRFLYSWSGPTTVEVLGRLAHSRNLLERNGCACALPPQSSEKELAGSPSV